MLLGIDKQGQWHVNDASQYLLNAHDPAHIALESFWKSASPPSLASRRGNLSMQVMRRALAQIDVVFPIVHGTLGEDGSLQGCCAWLTCHLSVRRTGLCRVHG